MCVGTGTTLVKRVQCPCLPMPVQHPHKPTDVLVYCLLNPGMPTYPLRSVDPCPHPRRHPERSPRASLWFWKTHEPEECVNEPDYRGSAAKCSRRLCNPSHVPAVRKDFVQRVAPKVHDAPHCHRLLLGIADLLPLNPFPRPHHRAASSRSAGRRTAPSPAARWTARPGPGCPACGSRRSPCV